MIENPMSNYIQLSYKRSTGHGKDAADFMCFSHKIIFKNCYLILSYARKVLNLLCWAGLST